MKIKISKATTDKITDALKTGQGKARARLLDAYDVKKAAADAEKDLEKMGIPKTMRKGVKVDFCPFSEKFASAYKGIPYGTRAEMIRGSKDWFLVGISRVVVNRAFPELRFYLSEEQKDRFIAEQINRFGVQGEA
jgi:hypothetical protein